MNFATIVTVVFGLPNCCI